MLQLNTNYDLVAYAMVVVILNSLLTEKILDVWVSLDAFVTPAAILLMICKANLIPHRLKCAPEKYLFERSCSPNTTSYPSISTRIRTPVRLNMKAQNRVVGLGGGGQG